MSIKYSKIADLPFDGRRLAVDVAGVAPSSLLADAAVVDGGNEDFSARAQLAKRISEPCIARGEMRLLHWTPLRGWEMSKMREM
jgi:hypothetical protein